MTKESKNDKIEREIALILCFALSILMIFMLTSCDTDEESSSESESKSESEEKPTPSGWSSDWGSDSPVVWGHTHSYTNGKCVCGAKQI